MTDEIPEEGWIPTLGWLEYQKSTQGDTPVIDYKKYGFDALEVPSDCPLVAGRMAWLTTRFNERYFNRMLGSETLDRWQVRLQNKFDELVYRMNRAYAIYAAAADALDSDLTGGSKKQVTGSVEDSGEDKITRSGSSEYSSTGGSTNTASGSDSNDNTSKHSETPDSEINNSWDYAGTVDVDKAKTTYGRVDTGSSNAKGTGSTSGSDSTAYGKKTATNGTEITTVSGNMIDVVNKNIKEWEDLDTVFVGSFENLFLNVFWY